MSGSVWICVVLINFSADVGAKMNDCIACIFCCIMYSSLFNISGSMCLILTQFASSILYPLVPKSSFKFLLSTSEAMQFHVLCATYCMFLFYSISQALWEGSSCNLKNSSWFVPSPSPPLLPKYIPFFLRFSPSGMLQFTVLAFIVFSISTFDEHFVNEGSLKLFGLPQLFRNLK